MIWKKNKYLFVVYLYNSYSQNSLWLEKPFYFAPFGQTGLLTLAIKWLTLVKSWCRGQSWVAFPVYNGIAYWTAMPVKVDENYYFSAQYGGATTFNQAISFGYNICPVADR